MPFIRNFCLTFKPRPLIITVVPLSVDVFYDIFMSIAHQTTSGKFVLAF